MKSKLSVTIITLNEERNIGKCIDSVSSIADEVVVVDSGSQDSTEEIARSRGAHFFHNPWPGHKEQKNYAIERASHEWILSLDADEWIDEALAKEIERVLDRAGQGADAFRIDRKTKFLGDFVQIWSPDWIVRLFRRDAGRFGGVNPHDVVELQPDTVCRKLENPFYHDSYQSLEQYFSRMNSYTSISSLALHRKGRKFALLKLLFSPLWMFLRKYLFKGGLRDGYRGLIISLSSGFYVFMKYAKLWSLEQLGSDGFSTGVSKEHAGRARGGRARGGRARGGRARGD